MMATVHRCPVRVPEFRLSDQKIYKNCWRKKGSNARKSLCILPIIVLGVKIEIGQNIGWLDFKKKSEKAKKTAQITILIQ